MGKKHRWHCGECHMMLHVTKGKKGTKYLYCPQCDKQVAYYNILPLLAPLIAAAAPSLIEAGGELIGNVLGGGKKSAVTATGATRQKLTQLEKALLVERAEHKPHKRR